MENSIFDIIMNYSVNEEMNKILLEDEEYIGIQKEIDEQTEEYEKPGLTKVQYLAVDRLVSAYTASDVCYGRVTYGKGFHDCVSLLQEMRLI